MNNLTESQIEMMIQTALQAFKENKVEKWCIRHDIPILDANPVFSLMTGLNRILEGHGTEEVSDEAIADVIYDSVDRLNWGDYIAQYINMGDMYVSTMIYDLVFNRLLFTTLGDYLEELEQVKAIADDIKSLIDSQVINWEEWLEEEGVSPEREGWSGSPTISNRSFGETPGVYTAREDTYYPIRIQKLAGLIYFHHGDPQFDSDLRGGWGSTYLHPDDDTYLEHAIDMYKQLL